MCSPDRESRRGRQAHRAALPAVYQEPGSSNPTEPAPRSGSRTAVRIRLQEDRRDRRVLLVHKGPEHDTVSRTLKLARSC